jgi:hypothetical protein
LCTQRSGARTARGHRQHARGNREAGAGRFPPTSRDDLTRESSAFGKTDARRVLAGILLRNEKISVTAVVTSVESAGTRARTRVRAVATGGAGLLPERGQTWEFDAAWRRENGAWRVFKAEWQESV